MDFSDLLEELSTIEGLERIRFTSPHPLHMDDKFFEVFAKNPKVCKSMHMPLQKWLKSNFKSYEAWLHQEWYLDRALKLKNFAQMLAYPQILLLHFQEKAIKTLKKPWKF